jgi:hypothetical protein
VWGGVFFLVCIFDGLDDLEDEFEEQGILVEERGEGVV